MTRYVAPHGSRTAYNRHLRLGEEPCPPCKRANSVSHRELMAQPHHRLRNQSWSWALRQMGTAYPEEYDELLATSLGSLEPNAEIDHRIRNRHRQRVYRRLKDRHPVRFDELFVDDFEARLASLDTEDIAS